MKNKPAIIAHAPWCYVADFLPVETADHLFNRLLTTCEWIEEEIWMFGRRVTAPRLVSFCGEVGVDYRYSGVTHVASGWPRELTSLITEVAQMLGHVPDFLLINRYRNGRDYMGWHRDDEAMAGAEVATLSLGSSRRFLIENAAGGPSHQLDLQHGSLLMMDRHCRHALPKTRRQVGERISLSFRVIG